MKIILTLPPHWLLQSAAKAEKAGISHQQNLRSDTMQHCSLLNPLDSTIDSRGYITL